MMRTKVTCTLVALAAVAAANPLPKHGPTSVAALEDNATCELLVFTDESQCALAIGVGPNDVEESGGLERRVNMRNALHQFKDRLNKIKSCAQAFLDKCSHNTPAPHQNSNDNQSEQNRRIPLFIPFHDTMTYYLPDMSLPVRGTNITIDESPRMFVISFENDLSRKDEWVEEMWGLRQTYYWAETGYNKLDFMEANTGASFTCSNPNCDFHLVAHILNLKLGLSIEWRRDDLSWHFYIPRQSPPQNIWGNEGASDDEGAPSKEGAPNNEAARAAKAARAVSVGMEKLHVR